MWGAFLIHALVTGKVPISRHTAEVHTREANPVEYWEYMRVQTPIFVGLALIDLALRSVRFYYGFGVCFP